MAKVKAWNGKRFKKFSSAIRALRRERGMSQEQLAAAISVEVEYVSMMERNLRRPSIVLRRKMASALSVTFDDLQEIVTRDQPPPVRGAILLCSRRASLGR